MKKAWKYIVAVLIVILGVFMLGIFFYHNFRNRNIGTL